MASRYTAHLLMVGVVTMWSGAFAFIKVALPELGPWHLTLARFLVCIPFFAVILAFTGAPRFPRRDWMRISLLGFLSVPGYHLALNYGEETVSAGTAALIVASGPLWTALLSAVQLHESFPPRKILGVPLALSGVLLLILTSGESFHSAHVWGAAITLLAPISWAIYTVYSKPLLSNQNPAAFTAFVTLLGTVYLVPLAASDHFPTKLANLSAPGWIAVAYLAIFASVLGYLGYIAVLKRLSPTQTVVYVYLNPFLALIWAYFLLDEVPRLISLVGGIIVIVGILLTNWPSPTRPTSLLGETTPQSKA